MRRNRRWIIADPDPRAPELARALKTSPIIAQMLLNRGIHDTAQGNDFLRPNPRTLHEPSLIPGLTHASKLIARAIEQKLDIVLYGDYDVDGITSVAILWHAIRLLGGKVRHYIPHRVDEGYGLNADAVTQLCDSGAKLIITVDCGIAAIEPAKIARERGVSLVITDHHEMHHAADGTPVLPDCDAIVHPRLATANESDAYRNPHLCGAGVAFKLAWGIGKAVTGSDRVSEQFREFLIDASALCALGTIADVVPLVGENRVLVHFGLSGLRQTRLIGLRALIDSARLNTKNIDTYHVGFQIAPRLNACGRMGHAGLAVEMLTDADEQKARSIATYLEEQNRARQSIERKITEEAIAQAEELNASSPDVRAIVLGSANWHPGVIGIVASRIVDRYHKPTIMVALGNGIGQGSGRSVNGFHLARALESCADILDAFGGHEMAAGLKVKQEDFEAFRERFMAHAREQLDAEALVPQLKLDVESELDQITQALVNDLRRLEPFGHANRKPLIACRNLELVSPPRRVGKTGDHLQLYVRQGRQSMKAIAFGAGEWFDKLQPGVRLNLAVEPTVNEWNGRTTVELDVKDLQIC